jgi:aminoglycoside 2'-N-acetyltransferase I
LRTSLFPTGAAPAGMLPQIRQLLDEAFAEDFTDDDWEHALGGWHVVVLEGSTPVSHAACVPRILEAAGPFRTGYVEGEATAPRRRGQGLASLALSELGMLIRRNFELGALSTGSHTLYERLGWERWRGATFVRRGDELSRTEEDDDGLMVLRFGPSRELDLSATISCEERSGEDW